MSFLLQSLMGNEPLIFVFENCAIQAFWGFLRNQFAPRPQRHQSDDRPRALQLFSQISSTYPSRGFARSIVERHSQEESVILGTTYPRGFALYPLRRICSSRFKAEKSTGKCVLKLNFDFLSSLFSRQLPFSNDMYRAISHPQGS